MNRSVNERGLQDGKLPVRYLSPIGPQYPKTKGVKFWLKRLFLGGLIFAVLIHVYALSLKFFPVPITANMLMRTAGETQLSKDWTRIEDISPHMIHAVMGGEDTRFCVHHGIDFEAVQQALEDNQEGGRRGGSTITQQTAKNVFFWNGGGYLRKAGEAWFAVFIDAVWGKRRVMEVYLNVAEWGDGIYGVQAASQTRFGKDAKDLTPREAALLASVLPSPNKCRVDPPGPYVSARAETLQHRMQVIQLSRFDSCV